VVRCRAVLDFKLVALAIAPLVFGLGCASTEIPGGRCNEDSECPNGELCVVDLNRSSSYCARRCELDKDCLPDQACRTGADLMASGATEIKLCIERIRMCSADEPCNGLDDDCDGTIDGASCAPITGCLDDATCGAFVCTAPDNQPAAICAPRNENATARDFAPCTADGDCVNGVCETGICSPFCRAYGDECEVPGLLCARAAGPKARPKHNSCQEPCMSPSDCSAPQECVFRDVYQGPNTSPTNVLHAFVCSIPGPERIPLGGACNANTIEGDDECAHGLCFGRVCTQICGGPGSDCSAVGAGFACTQQRLIYGTTELPAFICTRS
jgi:hypothetical protein